MINNKSVLRFATREDFDFFYPNQPMILTAKAWVLEKEGKKLGIGGIWLQKNKNTAFAKITKEASAKEFWKASKEVANKLKKLNLSIAAIRDETILSSERYLKRLGFTFYNIQNNQEIWKQQQ